MGHLEDLFARGNCSESEDITPPVQINRLNQLMGDPMTNAGAASAFLLRAQTRSTTGNLHGSEENFDRANRAQGVSPVPATFDSESARQVIATERANVSVEPFGGKLESPKYEIGELTATTKMTYLELCMYLEERGVSEETIAMVMKRRITGKQLSHLCKHEQCEQLLEDNLHISNPLTLSLIHI